MRMGEWMGEWKAKKRRKLLLGELLHGALYRAVCIHTVYIQLAIDKSTLAIAAAWCSI